ncbi:hypothetical protein P4O66_017128, partial [Electrophorus voltai]
GTEAQLLTGPCKCVIKVVRARPRHIKQNVFISSYISHRPVFACGGNLTGDTGFIGSQGYPGIYPSNSKCVWRITVPRGQVVSLSFRVLDLENDSLCRYDYVDVYDGYVNGQRLGRFCGTSRPSALVASGNKMHVVMVSDANTAGSGFLAAYAAVHPHERGERYCGGRLDEPSGTLKTPNWPDRDYPAGVTCSWHIVAPENQASFSSLLDIKDTIIELKFEKFDVERDNYCRYDHVAVYNGPETIEARRIGRFCGDSTPTPIFSEGSQLFIQFVSDLSLTADGFIGHYLFKPKYSSITRSFPTTTPATLTTLPMGLYLCRQHNMDKHSHIQRLSASRSAGGLEQLKVIIARVTLVLITGTLISAAMQDQSVLATFSITSLHKEGNLTVQQAGKAMSTRVVVLCKKCPLVRR